MNRTVKTKAREWVGAYNAKTKHQKTQTEKRKSEYEIWERKINTSCKNEDQPSVVKCGKFTLRAKINTIQV